MVQNIVHRWGDFSGAGKVSPPDLRRTAITRALSYRQVQMMSGHADPQPFMRYDQNCENRDQNAINLLTYH
jgi:integrase